MPLNIISNFAAQVAHRNLTMSDAGASSSVAKISAGTRVLGARDDAAALAIGSRLRAEVAAMTQASVNAGQAVSMLQIADGAMSQINDTLVRMKSLSVQAGSDQLGSVERGLINTEFQQLLAEIERIAQNTQFNGLALINGGVLSQLMQASDAGTDGISGISLASTVEDGAVFQYSYNATGEILTLTKLGVDGVTTNDAKELVDSSTLSFAFSDSVAEDAVFAYSYNQTTEQFTLTNRTTGESSTIDLSTLISQTFGAGVTTVPAGESLAVELGSLGVTVTFEQGFNFGAAITATTEAASTVPAEWTITGGSAVTFATGLSDAAIAALNDLLTAGQLDIDATAAGGTTVVLDANANLAYGINGGTAGALNAASGDLVAANSVEIYIDVDGTLTQVASIDTTSVAWVANGATGALQLDFNQRVSNTQTTTATDDQTAQIDITSALDSVAGAGNNLAFNQTLDVAFAQFGVTITLDKGFDRGTDISTTIGAVGTPLPTGVSATTFDANTQFLSADVYQALLDLGYNSSSGVGYNANTGVLSLQVNDDGATYVLEGQSGLNFGFGDGNATGDLAGAAQSIDVSIALADGSSVKLGTLDATFAAAAGAGLGTIDIQLGKGVFFNQVNEDALTNDFTFKIGTGNETHDRITLSLNSVNQQALGINGLDVTTAATADAASVAISAAIDVLNNARANVGAFQNRLDIAASNLATARENTEAARSALLDLDVAAEMTKFTSQQILVQAGVSMLAQANQLPQNLLRLLQ